MGKTVYVVGNSSEVCGWYSHIVTAVVIKVGYNVIASSGVYSKIFSAFVTFVGYDFDSWQSKWCLVKVE